MSTRAMQMLTGKRAGWLAAGMVTSVVMLAIIGYRAISEWQHSAALLAQRRADAAAEQLLTAITRDMRSVQTTVLATLPLDQATPNMLIELNAVGSAFARYPYAEVFFASVPADGRRESMTYYVRTDRVPSWLSSADDDVPFPVAPARSDAIDRLLQPAIAQGAVEGRQFIMFNVRLGDAPYQVVSFLRYTDGTRAHLASIVGFAVDLGWVRAHYFQDIVTQILQMQGPDPGLSLRVADGTGATVVETSAVNDGPSSTRRFPLLFFNPSLVALDPPKELAPVYWTVQAMTVDDRALLAARDGARRTMSIAGVTAVVLAFGIAFTLQAVRTNARLTTMKSEFVSAVTHELKTPIATIRAASETLASGRPLDSDRSREYAQLVVRESKRLTRLIDNLLAYSRITDLTEAYSFELLDAGSLIRHTLKEFQSQLAAADFDALEEVPGSLPPIRADRPAMSLALGNLIDNALRYSAERRMLRISARIDHAFIAIDVSDAGRGIPAHELPRVTQRFFRGEGAVAGGSGLGLAIVQRIVSDHAGTLSISSRLDVGTTVTLKLPHAGIDRETTHSDS